MKKSVAFIISVFIILSFTSHNVSASEEQYVLWEGTKLVEGQIGKIKVLKETDLLILNGNKMEFVRKLKPGEQFRVYQYNSKTGGNYGVGGALFIPKKRGTIEYKTPSKAKLAELKRLENPIELGGVEGILKSAKQFFIEDSQRLTKYAYDYHQSILDRLTYQAAFARELREGKIKMTTEQSNIYRKEIFQTNIFNCYNQSEFVLMAVNSLPAKIKNIKTIKDADRFRLELDNISDYIDKVEIKDASELEKYDNLMKNYPKPSILPEDVWK